MVRRACLLQPAMGVSMIGKQRRTPTATSSSPHFVFPSPVGPTSPPPLSSGYGSLSASQHTLSEADASLTAVGGPSPSPTPAPLSKSATSPQLGWAFRVLPGYGLQYPPTFTPDTYSLARLSQSQHTPPQGAVTSQQQARAEEAGQTPPPPPRTVSDCSTQTVAPPGETGGNQGRELRWSVGLGWCMMPCCCEGQVWERLQITLALLVEMAHCFLVDYYFHLQF